MPSWVANLVSKHEVPIHVSSTSREGSNLPGQTEGTEAVVSSPVSGGNIDDEIAAAAGGGGGSAAAGASSSPSGGVRKDSATTLAESLEQLGLGLARPGSASGAGAGGGGGGGGGVNSSSSSSSSTSNRDKRRAQLRKGRAAAGGKSKSEDDNDHDHAGAVDHDSEPQTGASSTLSGESVQGGGGEKGKIPDWALRFAKEHSVSVQTSTITAPAAAAEGDDKLNESTS